MLLAGCANQVVSSPPELMLPPDIDSELITIPAEPIAGEKTNVKVKLLGGSEPQDGMRIELRENTRATRLYDAEPITAEGELFYVIDAVFEQQGENHITLHFNVEGYHIMSSHSLEVK